MNMLSIEQYKKNVKEFLNDLYDDITYPIINSYTNIRNRLFKRYDLVRTGLNKYSYHDTPELMFHALMQMIVDFVEVEKCFEIIDFEGSNINWVGEEIKEIYNWYKCREKREREVSQALDNWHFCAFREANDIKKQNSLCSRLINNPMNSKMANRYFDIHSELERMLHEEDNEMCMRVVKIREYLWT